MNAHSLTTLVVAGGGIVAVVWVLHKVGKALAAVLEALATLAMLALAMWLVIKFGYWLVKTALTHWRTSLGLVLVGVWLVWWGLVVAGDHSRCRGRGVGCVALPAPALL